MNGRINNKSRSKKSKNLLIHLFLQQNIHCRLKLFLLICEWVRNQELSVSEFNSFMASQPTPPRNTGLMAFLRATNG